MNFKSSRKLMFTIIQIFIQNLIFQFIFRNKVLLFHLFYRLLYITTRPLPPNTKILLNFLLFFLTFSKFRRFHLIIYISHFYRRTRTFSRSHFPWNYKGVLLRNFSRRFSYYYCGKGVFSYIFNFSNGIWSGVSERALLWGRS